MIFDTDFFIFAERGDKKAQEAVEHRVGPA